MLLAGVGGGCLGQENSGVPTLGGGVPEGGRGCPWPQGGPRAPFSPPPPAPSITPPAPSSLPLGVQGWGGGGVSHHHLGIIPTGGKGAGLAGGLWVI